MKEHRDACQKGALEKSTLAEHAWENHRPIKWEEAIHIRLPRPDLNRDGGLEPPGCWMAALKGTATRVNWRQSATSGGTT